MKIHDSINQAAFAQLYYKELGIELSKDKAKKRFYALKKPDQSTIIKVMKKINIEIFNNIGVRVSRLF